MHVYKMCVYVCVYMCMYVYMCVCMYLSIYISIFLNVYVCVRVYIYIMCMDEWICVVYVCMCGVYTTTDINNNNK